MHLFGDKGMIVGKAVFTELLMGLRQIAAPDGAAFDPAELFDALGYWDALDTRAAEDRVDAWRRGEIGGQLVPEPPPRRPADETRPDAPTRNMYGSSFRRRPLKRFH